MQRLTLISFCSLSLLFSVACAEDNNLRNPQVSGESEGNDSADRNLRYYVKYDADGDDDGSSWENAFTDLQDALETARNAGGSDRREIWVAAGTYKPGEDIEDAFELADYIELYGGFNGDEQQLEDRDLEASQTILSGQLDEEEVGGPRSRSVLRIERVHDIVIDGFIIEFGKAEAIEDETVTEAELAGHAGGGIWCNDSTQIQLDNLTFRRNEGIRGGGLFVDGCEMNLSGQQSFAGNRATEGAAFYIASGTVTFQSESELTVSNHLRGGGFTNKGNLIFASNSSTVLSGNNSVPSIVGGGFSNYGTMEIQSDASFEIKNNQSEDGGGFYNAGNITFNNDVEVSENTGGGFYNQDGNVFVNGTLLISTNTGVGVRNFGQVSVENEGLLELSNNHGNVNAESPGGLANYGVLIVDDDSSLIISRNIGAKAGGFDNAGEIELYGAVTITKNTSMADGGGFLNDRSGRIDIGGEVELSENQAQGRGGGFYNGSETSNDSNTQPKIKIADGGSISGSDNSAPMGGGYFNAGNIDGDENIDVSGNSDNVDE